MFRCLVILFLLLFAGCASGVYSHYPKVKHQAKSEGHQPTQTKKQLLVIETLELKRVEKQTIAIIPPTKADFYLSTNLIQLQNKLLNLLKNLLLRAMADRAMLPITIKMLK